MPGYLLQYRRPFCSSDPSSHSLFSLQTNIHLILTKSPLIFDTYPLRDNLQQPINLLVDLSNAGGKQRTCSCGEQANSQVRKPTRELVFETPQLVLTTTPVHCSSMCWRSPCLYSSQLAMLKPKPHLMPQSWEMISLCKVKRHRWGEVIVYLWWNSGWIR